VGQINGIKMTGISHKPTILRFLLLFIKIRKATNGIIVTIGIFVNMAKPNEIPDNKIATNLRFEYPR
jgi:hypothetical protein